MTTTRLPLSELNELLTCSICKGYYKDAHTILECMHTFCKSCVLMFFHENCLKSNLRCPECGVNLGMYGSWGSKMIYDRDLQSIVDKLFPSFAEEEREEEAKFYKDRQIPLKGKQPKRLREESDSGRNETKRLKIITMGSSHSTQATPSSFKTMLRSKDLLPTLSSSSNSNSSSSNKATTENRGNIANVASSHKKGESPLKVRNEKTSSDSNTAIKLPSKDDKVLGESTSKPPESVPESVGPEFNVKLNPCQKCPESKRLPALPKRLCRANLAIRMIKIKKFILKRLEETDKKDLTTDDIELIYKNDILDDNQKLSTIQADIEEATRNNTTVEFNYRRAG